MDYRRGVPTTSEREELLAVLAELGIDPEDVPEHPGDAAALASDTVLARDDRYSLRMLEKAAELEEGIIAPYFAHLGIKVDNPDEVLFTDADVELAKFLVAAITELFTDDEGIEILHVAATALSMLAEASIAGHIQGPERRVNDAAEHVRLNTRIAELGLLLSGQLPAVFRHHIRHAALVNRRNQNLSRPELVTFTVGFLDLVGFTSLSQSMSTEDLVDLVKGFEAQAHELAHTHHARIVKLIGDEVMMVAETPPQAAAFVIGMIESVDEGGVVPRGGLAHGEVVNVHGDYFGPVVNLAARLVDSAVPGEVLVDDGVAAAEGVETEPAGRRMLKGFDDPVRVHTLLKASTT